MAVALYAEVEGWSLMRTVSSLETALILKSTNAARGWRKSGPERLFPKTHWLSNTAPYRSVDLAGRARFYNVLFIARKNE